MNQESDFQCLACTHTTATFSRFPEIVQHIQQQHGVEDVLGGPATKAVLLPRYLWYYTCLLCKEGQHFIGMENMWSHLDSRHGVFFRKLWQNYCKKHCRVCEIEVEDEDLELHINKKHPREKFAVTASVILNIEDNLDITKELPKKFSTTAPVIIDIDDDDSIENVSKGPDFSREGSVNLPPCCFMSLYGTWLQSYLPSNGFCIEEEKSNVTGFQSIKSQTNECSSSSSFESSLNGDISKSCQTLGLHSTMTSEDNNLATLKTMKVSYRERKYILGAGARILGWIKLVSGANIRVERDFNEVGNVTVWGRTENVRKAKTLLEVILEWNNYNIGENEECWQDQETLEGISFIYLSKYEVSKVLGHKGANIEAIRNSTDVLVSIHGEQDDKQRKILIFGSKEARTEAKAMIKKILIGEVNLKVSSKELFHIIGCLDVVTRETGAVVSCVFDQGLSIIGTEQQVNKATEMIRDIVVKSTDC